MAEDPKTVELRRIARKIEAAEKELEEVTKKRNHLRDVLDALYSYELDLETS